MKPQKIVAMGACSIEAIDLAIYKRHGHAGGSHRPGSEVFLPKS